MQILKNHVVESAREIPVAAAAQVVVAGGGVAGTAAALAGRGGILPSKIEVSTLKEALAAQNVRGEL